MRIVNYRCVLRTFAKLFILAIIISSFFATPVFAQKTIDDATGILNQVVQPTGMLNSAVPTDLPTALGFWIRTALTLVGIIFFIMMFYGGFLWLTAKESEEKVTKAKGIITMAIIGMFIVVASYAISSFMSDRIIQGNASNNAGTATPAVDVGPKGCCVDWVSGETQMFGTGGIRACRITTEADCQFQGENSSEYDKLFCPKGEGCWMFYTGSEFLESDGAEVCADAHC